MHTTKQGLAIVYLLLAGCAGQKLDIGDNNSSGGANGNGSSNVDSCGNPPIGTKPVPFPDPSACVPGSSALQGTWTGYLHDKLSGLDADSLELTLSGNDANLCGTVMFGQPRALPPVDPLVAYPRGWSMPLRAAIFEGFTYQLLKADVSGKRLQIGFAPSEPYASWCEQQTPYFDTVNPSFERWQCGPNIALTNIGGNRFGGKDPCTGKPYEVDMGRYNLCTSASICSCYRYGCQASPDQRLQFDLHFDGDDAQGDLNGTTVFLTRSTSSSDGGAPADGGSPSMP